MIFCRCLPGRSSLSLPSLDASWLFLIYQSSIARSFLLPSTTTAAASDLAAVDLAVSRVVNIVVDVAINVAVILAAARGAARAVASLSLLTTASL